MSPVTTTPAPSVKTPSPSSPYPVVFLRCRTIAFCAITFFCFIWIILLCVVLFLQWEFMDKPYQSIVLVMLLVDSVTAVVLLVLLTRKFRAWLDAARIALLLGSHIGASGAFAYWSPGFKCPQPTPDDRSMCRLLIRYILFSSWALPTLVLLYVIGLAIMSIHRARKIRLEAGLHKDIEQSDSDSDSIVVEKKRGDLRASKHSSFLMPLPSPSWNVSSPVHTPIASQFATTLSVPVVGQPRISQMNPSRRTTTVDNANYYLPSPAHSSYLTPSPPRGSPLSTPTNTHFAPPSPQYPLPNPYLNYAMPALPPASHGPHHRPNAQQPQQQYHRQSQPAPQPHWNHVPSYNTPVPTVQTPTTRARHYSYPTVLTENIPEETSSQLSSPASEYSAYSGIEKPEKSVKRASARLSKPPPSSRMPSL